jgi:hypothetical protein
MINTLLVTSRKAFDKKKEKKEKEKESIQRASER